MLLAFAIVVGVVVALGAHSNAQAPSRCCFPAQFQSGISEVGTEFDESTGIASASRVYTRSFVDLSDNATVLYRFNRVTERVIINRNWGTTPQRTVDTILNKDGVMHIFNDTHCLSQPMQPSFQGCITDSAQFLGTSYYWPGSNRLVTHAWRMVFENETRIVRVTADYCIPVTMDITGRRGNGNCFVEGWVQDTFPVLTPLRKDLPKSTLRRLVRFSFMLLSVCFRLEMSG